MLQRYHRFKLFVETENLASVYGPSDKHIKQRVDAEKRARRYIFSKCPAKYHSFIAPGLPTRLQETNL